VQAPAIQAIAAPCTTNAPARPHPPMRPAFHPPVHQRIPSWSNCTRILNYVKAGHYDNTVFHRVIDGFMIQGGGFEPGMKQKPTEAPITNEANNGLKNVNGSVAMARTNDPHSATAQFFININDNDFLNHSSPTPQGWGYAVFGKVVEGLDVVEKIRKVKTGSKGFHQDVPADDVIIEKAVIVE
jgi:peptidyl-prolyl cis-trans isomerase B (cyclophilin B)